MTFLPKIRLIFRLVRNREELGMYTQISLFVKHDTQEKIRKMKLYFPRTENFSLLSSYARLLLKLVVSINSRHFWQEKDIAMEIPRLIVKLFRNIGRSLVTPNIELQIKQKQDRDGNSYWQIYDLTTNTSSAFGSEQEVRAWMETQAHRF